MNEILRLIGAMLIEDKLGKVDRERLLAAREQIITLIQRSGRQSEECTELRNTIVGLFKTNAELRDKLTELKKHLDRFEQAEIEHEFVEHSGAFFRRKPDGGFHHAVYCPKCRVPASEFADIAFRCDSCDWHSSFSPSKLGLVIANIKNL